MHQLEPGSEVPDAFEPYLEVDRLDELCLSDSLVMGGDPLPPWVSDAEHLDPGHGSDERAIEP